jgi:cytoskeletal protein CcmA (bactofilin family)
MMFRRRDDEAKGEAESPSRVDSVLGEKLAWSGQLSGSGGVRIDGAFDGEIAVYGLVVIGREGRVSCQGIRALTVVVAGSVKGDITANRVEILPTGRVWGDVVTTSFSTEEGAFMRGQITMEEELDLGLAPPPQEEMMEEAPAQAEGGESEGEP